MVRYIIIKNVKKYSDKFRHVSLCLNDIRTNPPGADLERGATPQGCVPGTARIQNLAANLGRSPLTHSYDYGPAGDRPTSFVRRVPAPHPFGADAKNRSRRFFARFPLTISPGGRSRTSMCFAAPALPWTLQILNARQRGPQGGGQDAWSSFVPFMQYAGRHVLVG